MVAIAIQPVFRDNSGSGKMKRLFLFSLFFPLFLYGNSGFSSKDKCFQLFLKRNYGEPQYSSRSLFKRFLETNYSERGMRNHLGFIRQRDYPSKMSKTLINEFENSKDPAFRGMILKTLGEKRLAARNKKKIVSLMIEYFHPGRHYLERKGAVQGLGYLLKPTEQKEIGKLAEGLDDSSASVRQQTALSLGRIKPRDNRDIEQRLIEIAVNPKEEVFVREASLRVLKEIKPKVNKEIQRQLFEMAKNPDEQTSIKKLSSEVLDISQATHTATTNIYIYSKVELRFIEDLYRRHMDEKNKQHYNAPKPFGSWFAVRVFLAIHKKGYFVIPEFEFAANKTISRSSGQKPYRIDLVVWGESGRKLAIECDGRQHKRIQKEDQQRQEELESFGWEFWRISQRDFYSQPNQTLENLWKKLDEIKINPVSKNDSYRYIGLH